MCCEDWSADKFVADNHIHCRSTSLWPSDQSHHPSSPFFRPTASDHFDGDRSDISNIPFGCDVLTPPANIDELYHAYRSSFDMNTMPRLLGSSIRNADAADRMACGDDGLAGLQWKSESEERLESFVDGHLTLDKILQGKDNQHCSIRPFVDDTCMQYDIATQLERAISRNDVATQSDQLTVCHIGTRSDVSTQSDTSSFRRDVAVQSDHSSVDQTSALARCSVAVETDAVDELLRLHLDPYLGRIAENFPEELESIDPILLFQMEEHIEELESERDLLRAELDSKRVESERASYKVTDVQKKYDVIKEQCKLEQKIAADLRRDIDSQTSVARTLRAELDVARFRNVEVRTKLSNTEETNEKLRSRNVKLRECLQNMNKDYKKLVEERTYFKMLFLQNKVRSSQMVSGYTQQINRLTVDKLNLTRVVRNKVSVNSATVRQALDDAEDCLSLRIQKNQLHDEIEYLKTRVVAQDAYIVDLEHGIREFQAIFGRCRSRDAGRLPDDVCELFVPPPQLPLPPPPGLELDRLVPATSEGNGDLALESGRRNAELREDLWERQVSLPQPSLHREIFLLTLAFIFRLRLVRLFMMFFKKRRLPTSTHTHAPLHTSTHAHTTHTLSTVAPFSACNVDTPSASIDSLNNTRDDESALSNSNGDDISRTTLNTSEKSQAPASSSSWQSGFMKLFACCFKRNQSPTASESTESDTVSVADPEPTTSNVVDTAAAMEPSTATKLRAASAQPTKHSSFAERRREYLSSKSLSASSTRLSDHTGRMNSGGSDVQRLDRWSHTHTLNLTAAATLVHTDSSRTLRRLPAVNNLLTAVHWESVSSVAAPVRTGARHPTDTQPTPGCSHGFYAPTDGYSLSSELEASYSIETELHGYQQLVSDEIARLESRLSELRRDEVTLRCYQETAEAVSRQLEKLCKTESLDAIQDPVGPVAAVAGVRQELQTRVDMWTDQFRNPVSCSPSGRHLVPDLCWSLAHELNKLDKVIERPLTPRSYDSDPSLSHHTPLPMSLPRRRSVSMPNISSVERPVFTPTFSEGTSLSDVFRPRNYRFDCSPEDGSSTTHAAAAQLPEEEFELDWEDEEGDPVELEWDDEDGERVDVERQEYLQQHLAEDRESAEVNGEVSDLDWEHEVETGYF